MPFLAYVYSSLYVSQWIYAARTRLIPNVHINGLALTDYAKQEAGEF